MKNRITSEELRNRLSIEAVTEIVRRGRLTLERPTGGLRGPQGSLRLNIFVIFEVMAKPFWVIEGLFKLIKKHIVPWPHPP